MKSIVPILMNVWKLSRYLRVWKNEILSFQVLTRISDRRDFRSKSDSNGITRESHQRTTFILYGDDFDSANFGKTKRSGAEGYYLDSGETSLFGNFRF
ncbi:hypothetical protein DLM75_04210 [Leptospira stimsonii]|uniref:Uncharacterized protein n=1 Tax=Leptospira stimsonii TaxID=2202203 RepID=A0A396Z9Z2_9LEPT|nr:hypothetical protein DLM75_04210 [Leptospira stimsonii]